MGRKGKGRGNSDGDDEDVKGMLPIATKGRNGDDEEKMTPVQQQPSKKDKKKQANMLIKSKKLLTSQLFNGFILNGSLSHILKSPTNTIIHKVLNHCRWDQ